MPNPGGVYLGCETCRRRKIKCDQRLAGCSNCAKYNSPCPGYPEERDARFRNETQKTVQRAKLLVLPSLVNLTRQTDSSQSDKSNNLLQAPNREDKPLPTIACVNDHKAIKQSVSLVQWISSSTCLACPLSLPGETVLTHYFFDQVLMPVGWYSYLPQLYQRSLQNGLLRLTVTAASMFLAANQFQDAQLLHRARSLYSALLQKMNAAISHSQHRLEDETLCSILILNVLDDINGQKSFAGGTHLNGCAQLLKLREDQGFWTPCTPDLAHSIVIQTQAHVVRSYQPLEGISNVWLCDQTKDKPAGLVYMWCLEIGRLQKVASNLLLSDSNTPSSLDIALLSMIREAEELDTRVANWYISGGPRWSHRTADLCSSTGQRMTADYYADVQVAKVWNQYRSARIILQQIKINVAQRLKNCEPADEDYNLVAVSRDSLPIITSMISGICNSILFHLQKVDASGRQCSPQSQQVLGGCALIWPLEVVLRCTWCDIHHRHQANAALEEIGRVIGVKQALVSPI